MRRWFVVRMERAVVRLAVRSWEPGWLGGCGAECGAGSAVVMVSGRVMASGRDGVE